MMWKCEMEILVYMVSISSVILLVLTYRALLKMIRYHELRDEDCISQHPGDEDGE